MGIKRQVQITGLFLIHWIIAIICRKIYMNNLNPF